MVGLDTNLLVRIFTNDDSSQLKKAKSFIASNCSRQSPGLICIATFVELLWVLSNLYDFDRDDIAQVVTTLLNSEDLKLIHEKEIRASLSSFEKSKCGFSDILIGELNREVGCSTTKTFDKKASKLDTFSLL